MIPQSEYRFSEKIMVQQKAKPGTAVWAKIALFP
jgi:hypothetical protein